MGIEFVTAVIVIPNDLLQSSLLSKHTFYCKSSFGSMRVLNAFCFVTVKPIAL